MFSGTGNDGTLTANPVQSSSGRLATFKGNALAASPRYSFMLDETGVRAIDRQAYRRASANAQRAARSIESLKAELKKTGLSRERRTGLQRQLGQLGESLDAAKQARAATEQWRISVLRRHTIIALANCVVLGGDGFVEARSLVDGSVQWLSLIHI